MTVTFYAIRMNQNPKLCWYGGKQYSGPVFLYSAKLYKSWKKAFDMGARFGGYPVRIEVTYETREVVGETANVG